MKRHDTEMSTDDFERLLAQALRQEAYRVPHHVTVPALERRLERAPRQLAPARRWLGAVAAVVVLIAVVVGAPLVAPSFLPGSGPPPSDGCEVSSGVSRGPAWTEIGTANVFFNARARGMPAGESYLITARFDPDAATGDPVGMHAERMGSGERVDAEAHGRIDPATQRRTPLPPIPSLPGGFYAFGQPFPTAGCWRLVGTIDGRPVGSAVVEVGPEVVPVPGGPTEGASSPLRGLDTTPLDPIVTVNDVPVGKLGQAGLELDRSLPPLPWAIAATTPTGRVLVTLEIPGEDHEGTYARADLSCGTVMLWFGNEPIYGPAPPLPDAGGTRGDCEP